MNRLLVCIGFLGVVASAVEDGLVHEPGRCVSYGFSSDNRHYNLYNGPPLPLTDSTAAGIIQDLCPMFRDIPVCCDGGQLAKFAERSFLAAFLLKECSSCWYNFRTVLCQQMCSPDQSSFMKVLEQYEIEGSNARVVRSLQVSLTKEYAVKLFDSCKDVQAFGQNAILLICNNDECNHDLLLKELGDNTSRAPYYTEFLVGNARDSVITPLQADVLSHCWEVPEDSDEACSCDHCKDACAVQ